MFLNLVLKEFKNGALFDKLKKKNFLSLFLNLVLAIGFVFIEIYLYKMINEKLMAFKGASLSFLTIFLFVVSIAHILFLTAKVRKTMYSKTDSDILINKPVSPVLNIMSKIVFIYLRDVMMNYLISFPILMVYGMSNNVISRVSFLMFLYPIIISIFETGLSYLLSLPYEEIHLFLKKHFIVQVITSIIIILGLCFVYSYILNSFLVLVRDNNIYAIFSKDTITKLDDIAKFLIPTRFYIQLISLDYSGLLYILLISLAIFIIGGMISSGYYMKSLNREKINKNKNKEKEVKLTSENKALLKKELALFFEDSNSIFSSSGLLVMEPFLTVLVIQAMNTIFKTGALTYVISFFPYLLPIMHILFVVLFSTFINASSSFVISREKHNGIRICKTIPISYQKQILIKLLVPFTLSSISLFISVLVLLISGQVSVLYGILAFFFGLFLSSFLELVSIYNDLKYPTKENEDSNKSSLISLLAIALPMVFVGGMFLLSYLGLPLVASYFILLAILLLVLGGYVYLFNKKVTKLFVSLEMRN